MLHIVTSFLYSSLAVFFSSLLDSGWLCSEFFCTVWSGTSSQCPLESKRKQFRLSSSHMNCNEVFHSVSHLKATMENTFEGGWLDFPQAFIATLLKARRQYLYNYILVHLVFKRYGQRIEKGWTKLMAEKPSTEY